MAIWQCAFFVLDKLSFETLKSQEVDEEGFMDETVYWRYSKTTPSVFEELLEFLPIGKSWSDNLIVYGNLESSCLEVLVEEGFVISCSFRIDFTTDFDLLLSRIVNFLEKWNFTILSAEDLEEIPLNAYSIEVYIKNSRKYRIHHNLVEGNDPFYGVEED